jgi:hypothetical protein
MTREEFERLAAQNAQVETDYANRVFDVVEGKTPRSSLGAITYDPILKAVPEMQEIHVTSEKPTPWGSYFLLAALALVGVKLARN